MIILHLIQITSENEATIMRLTEQAKVLKEEIRRLERNQQRENAIANMEYLKNVVMKVSLEPGLGWEGMLKRKPAAAKECYTAKLGILQKGSHEW